MRPTRFVLSIRTLMILVALVGLGMGCWQLHRRSTAFSELADDFASLKDRWGCHMAPVLETREEYADWRKKMDERFRLHQAYYGALEEKYRRASRAPWLPVEPDPSPP